MRKERVRSKHGFKGFGSFIVGWFVGLLSTILILAGVGYWAYTSVTVKRVEKWTKSNITSNEGVEGLTLQKVVAIAQGIAKGSDSYTIAKFEEDFNIKFFNDSLFGISMDKLKNSPIKDFSKAISSTIENATFANVLNFMDIGNSLGLLDTILHSSVTYYIYNGKLYEDKTYATMVDFEYTIVDGQVEFANGKHTIKTSNGYTIITPTLEHLPLKTAISDMENATKDLKIYEVLGYTQEATDTPNKYIYKDGNVEVTGIMASLAGYSVNDLSKSETFDTIKIYEVMGYYEKDGKYYTDSACTNKVDGVIGALAGKTIKELSNDSTYDNLYIYEVMGYYTDGDKYYTDKSMSNEVTGIIKHFAGSSVQELSNKINALTIGEVLDVEYSTATGVIKALHGTRLDQLQGRINSLTLGEALGVAEADATGIIKTFYKEPINELAGKIENIKIYQAMGYTQEATGTPNQYIYKDNGVEVTGIMASLAGHSVADLSKSETFDTIKIYEVLGYYEKNGKYYTDSACQIEVTGIMALLAETQLQHIETRIDQIINGMTLNKLCAKGVINGALNTNVAINVGDKNIPELIEWLNENIDNLLT